MENIKLPSDLAYDEIEHLSLEAKQKLKFLIHGIIVVEILIIF